MTTHISIDHSSTRRATMIAALVAAGIGGMARKPEDTAFEAMHDLIVFGQVAYDEAAIIPPEMYHLPAHNQELPWFIPTKRKSTVPRELDAATFKSKRVKAARSRKRNARKARSAMN